MSTRDRVRVDARDLVLQALEACEPNRVARELGVSAHLVRGWGYGRSSPSLNQILQAPRTFGLRLLVLGREYLDTSLLALVDTDEALHLAMTTLGALLLSSKTPASKKSIEQLRQDREKAAKLEEQAGTLRRAYDAAIQEREAQDAAREGV